MSRIGKKPIAVPEKTSVSMRDGFVVVTGPLGELKRSLKPVIKMSVDGNTLSLTTESRSPESRALWGTYASHIRNMIAGVNTKYTKKLIIEGIGFKADIKGDTMTLSLGFSHPVQLKIPSDLTVTSEKGVVTVTGIDKELVGQFTAHIRSLKKPEPYKGKGIRYENEVIRRKQGKKTT